MTAVHLTADRETRSPYRPTLVLLLQLAQGGGALGLAILLTDAAWASLTNLDYFVLSWPFLKSIGLLAWLFAVAGASVAVAVGLPLALTARRWWPRLTRRAFRLAAMICTATIAVPVLGLVLASVLAPSGVERRIPPSTPDVPAGPDRPNIVLIIADSLRQDALEGTDAEVLAPTLFELGRESVAYSNAHSVSSWTRPSAAGIVTGRYPTELGAHAGGLSNRALTIAELLHDAGYETAGFSDNPLTGPRKGFAQGHDYYWHKSAAVVVENMRVFYSRFLPGAARERLQALHRTMRVRCRLAYTGAPELNRNVERWLGQRNPNRPFYLFIHYMDTHYPFFVYDELPSNWSNRSGPETYLPYYAVPFRSAKDRENGFGPFGNLSIDPAKKADFLNRYYGSLQFLDHHVSDLFQKLQEETDWDQTLVIFTSDHGEEFFEHGWFSHGYALYEESTRVPLLVKQPRDIQQRGLRNNDLVSLLQLAPTILQVAGATQPQVPMLQPLTPNVGEAAPTILGEYSRWGMQIHSAWSGRYKLLESNAEGGRHRIELFDLVHDPGERNNLWPEASGIVVDLFGQLQAFRASLANYAQETPPAVEDPEAIKLLKALGYL